MIVKGCNQKRKSYVLLELGNNQKLLSKILAGSKTNAVTVFRSEPPIAGT